MNTGTIPNPYHPSSDMLSGKVILVTGAGDGIGRAAALSFASHGATVVLLGRTTTKLESVYDEIEAAGGPQAAIFPMDLESSTQEQFEALANALHAEFGKLDGLLHNASLLGERKPIAIARLDDWQSVMKVNVDAGFMLTKHTLPLLEAASNASVIFTSSGVGRVGKAYWGAYAVSKFATEGLMQVLASELENTSRIRVNSLNPGATNTAMRRTAYPGETPTDNPEPGAIMPAYLYLMGDESVGVTGQAFNAQ